MYAVIKTGGKQYRVTEGQRLDVEKLAGDEVELSPVLVVDGSTVLATPDELAAATVGARVVGEAKGPKIDGFTYKNKSNQRKRWGHRQHYATIEITSISTGTQPKTRAKSDAKAKSDAPADTDAAADNEKDD
jgi:large subunit ribosomal protein L21